MVICLGKGCKAQSNFALQGQKACYCNDHKLTNMINVITKKCIYKKCETQSSFGLKGQKALYCVKHKLTNMINVVSKLCLYEKCEIRPIYGFKGQKAQYCVNHKLTNMIDVVHKTCISEGCKTLPIYGFEGQKAQYCVDHKLTNMIDVVNKTCLYEKCKTLPSYGFEGQKAQYCVDHKLTNMIDVINKPCLYEKCKITPSYGFEGQKAQYCVDHKLTDMIDVVNKTCIVKDCAIRANYGNNLLGKIHCFKHHDKKTEWKLTTCKNNKCRNIAIRSQNGTYPYEFCDKCSPLDYTSHIANRCISCGLTNMIVDIENKCLDTCTEIHKERIKYSETQMLDKFNSMKYNFIYDKIVQDGCSSKRPDFIFDLESGFLIIENDENQHKSRTCECEQTRMIQIHQDHGGSPVHFIRFNPDKYKIINKSVDNLHIRLEFLCKIIDKIKKDEDFFIRNPYLTTSYLYYDDWDGNFTVYKIEY